MDCIIEIIMEDTIMVGTIITVDIITMEDTITMITIIITEADGAGVVVVHGEADFSLEALQEEC
ncbi:Uncharacterised protein [Streptococcus pneumoniae]|nr:Uncharacterised protein [Streptococcus pneumoniae]CRH97442.1 Uncharacterised protein [Streptococcus pneumoniae]